MSNKCIYEMKIIGNDKDIKKLISYLKSEYQYNDNELLECTGEKHFFGVYKCDIVKKEKKYDKYQYVISGTCAWSVMCCMFDECNSYYNHYNKLKKDNFKGTTILKESKLLNLVIEIFSQEMINNFMEHFVIQYGKLITSENINYKEEYNEKLEEYTIVDGIEWKYKI